MSDRSVEDELIAEARKFGHSLTHMLRLHAQAATWLERRRVRKQISVVLREQRRAEETTRKHQLVWTQQMIDRYRTHALAVTDRAENPSVDHERRYRDTQSLNRHATDLRARIVGNDRLTKTEQGIALDGLDAATTFPRFEPGRLFAKAHKVRGIDALKYRAQVARTVREQPTNAAQRVSLEELNQRLSRYGELRAERAPYDEMTYEQRAAYDRETAANRHRIIADTHILGADQAETVATTRHAAEQSRPTVDRPWQGRDVVSKPFVVNVGPADVIHMDEHEFARVAREDHPQLRTFETREQAYDWALNQLDAYRETSSRRGEDFTATIRERGRRDSSEVVDGPLGMVTDEIRVLRDEHTRRGAQPQTRTAEPETNPPSNSRSPAVTASPRSSASSRTSATTGTGLGRGSGCCSAGWMRSAPIVTSTSGSWRPRRRRWSR